MKARIVEFVVAILGWAILIGGGIMLIKTGRIIW